MSSLEDHQDPDRTDDDGGERPHPRDPRHGRGDVAEQRIGPAGEHQPLAPFGAVGLDDANPAERLPQAAGHVGVQLAAVPKQRPQLGERVRHAAAEARQDEDRDQREPPVQVEQHPQRNRRRHEPADELHQTRADQVADALGVRHDARDQDAALGRVEVADRKPQDIRLHGAPHVGNGALGGDAEQLRQAKPGDGLDERGTAGRERQGQQQLGVMLIDDPVDDPLGRGGQDQARQPVDEQQAEPQGEAAAVRVDERPRLLPGAGRDGLLGGSGRGVGHGSQRNLNGAGEEGST